MMNRLDCADKATRSLKRELYTDNLCSIMAKAI